MPRGRRKRVKLESQQVDAISILAQKINECETVIAHLKTCPAWAVITKDLTEQKQRIDDHWHDITDEKKLQKARELKYAYVHLLSLIEKYGMDLETARQEMEVMQKPDVHISKDYDGE